MPEDGSDEDPRREMSPARGDTPAGSRTLEGRIHGDAPWGDAINFSYRWIGDATMNRVVNSYLEDNWAAIRSDLAVNGRHAVTFDTGEVVGEGFYNSNYGSPTAPSAVYSRTGVVTITIDLTPGSSPPDLRIIRALPTWPGWLDEARYAAGRDATDAMANDTAELEEASGSRAAIRAKLSERMQASAPSPMEQTRDFLRSYCSDADNIEEVRGEAAATVNCNSRPVLEALVAIESVIADPPADGRIAEMVAIDANRQLADPSDTGALEYLRRIAGLLRNLVGQEAEGPR